MESAKRPSPNRGISTQSASNRRLALVRQYEVPVSCPKGQRRPTAFSVLAVGASHWQGHLRVRWIKTKPACPRSTARAARQALAPEPRPAVQLREALPAFPSIHGSSSQCSSSSECRSSILWFDESQSLRGPRVARRGGAGDSRRAPAPERERRLAQVDHPQARFVAEPRQLESAEFMARAVPLLARSRRLNAEPIALARVPLADSRRGTAGSLLARPQWYGTTTALRSTLTDALAESRPLRARLCRAEDGASRPKREIATRSILTPSPIFILARQRVKPVRLALATGPSMQPGTPPLNVLPVSAP